MKSFQSADRVIRITESAIQVMEGDRTAWRARTVPLLIGARAAFGRSGALSLDSLHRTPTDVLTAALFDALGDQVQGTRVVLVVPDEWGPHRTALIEAPLTASGAKVRTSSETAFLLQRSAAADTDTAVVLRIGSASTTATLMKRGDQGWALSHRLETSWGAEDLDDELIRFVDRRLQSQGSGVTAELRAACISGREHLSKAVHTDIVDPRGTVRVHRADLDELARPGLKQALRATLQTLIDDLPDVPDTIWLTGGAAATPLVAQLASEIAERPVNVLDWATLAAAELHSPEAPQSRPVEDTKPVPAPAKPVSDSGDKSTGSRWDRLKWARGPFAGLLAAGVLLVAFATAAAFRPGDAGSILNMLVGDTKAPTTGRPANAAPPGASRTANPDDARKGTSWNPSDGSTDPLRTSGSLNQAEGSQEPPVPGAQQPGLPSSTVPGQTAPTTGPGAENPAVPAPGSTTVPSTTAPPPPPPATTTTAPPPPATTTTAPPPPPPDPTTEPPPATTEPPPADPEPTPIIDPDPSEPGQEQSDLSLIPAAADAAP